jgi:hypothetical protein
MRRGYILLEVMMGGALTALVVAGLLSSLADARVRNIVAGRDAVAASLAQDMVEEVRSRGFGNAGGLCTGAFAPVSNNQAVYRRKCTLTAAATHALQGVNVTFEKVDVVVEFDSTIGKRTAKASTRIYQ